MLSDHIVFWMRHNRLPVFESEFEMLLYEQNVFMIQWAKHAVTAMGIPQLVADAVRKMSPHFGEMGSIIPNFNAVYKSKTE